MCAAKGSVAARTWTVLSMWLFYFIFVNNLTGSPNILKPGIIWSSYHILKENPFHRAMEDFVLYKYVL